MPGCQAPQTPCYQACRTRSSPLPSFPSFLAREVVLLSAGESRHRGERLQDPRCTGRTIPGHSAPAAAIVRSKHQRRGRCGRAGELAQLTAWWEHAYLHLPGEGKEGRATGSPLHPSQVLVSLRVSWGLGQALTGRGTPVAGRLGGAPSCFGTDVPFPPLLQPSSNKQPHRVTTKRLEHNRPSTVEKQLPGKPGHALYGSEG